MYQKHIESKTAVINLELKKIAEICKIDNRLSTHVSRHTFALWASRKEVDLGLIQQMLNHSSKSMTENYIKDLHKSDKLDQAAAMVLS